MNYRFQISCAWQHFYCPHMIICKYSDPIKASHGQKWPLEGRKRAFVSTLSHFKVQTKMLKISKATTWTIRFNSHCSSQTTICGTVQIEFFFETWSIWKVYPTLGYVQKISPLGPPWSEILRHFQFLWFLLYVVKHFITLEKIAAVRISRFLDTSP